MQALVLGGGGSRGSWQAGAILAIAQDPRFFHGFDFISGTSVGAINAAALAMYDKERIVEAAQNLRRLWASKLKIWSLRFPPYLAGLWKPSIGNNKGLRKLIDRELDAAKVRDSNVYLSVTAVDLQTGKVCRFNHAHKNLRDVLLASGSVPVAFEPVELEHPDVGGVGYFTDGGVKDVAPLQPAIRAGATEITVVLTSNPYADKKYPKGDFKNVVQVAERVIGLMQDDILFNDVRECLMRNMNDNYRHIRIRLIHPTEDGLASSLEFDQKIMQAQIERGMRDAREQLSVI